MTFMLCSGLACLGKQILFRPQMADQLDQLSDAAARYATAQEDLPKRKQALSESNRKVDLILATLGQSDVDDPKSLLIPAATIGTLRDLISEKSGVDVARQSAEREYEAARQAVEKEQCDRQALDGQGAAFDAGKIAHLQSVLRRLRDGNLVAETRFAERAVPVKRQAFHDAAIELHPWAGDGDALRRISPPGTERLEPWKSTHSELEKRRSQIVERERELSTKQEEDAARLAALRDAIDIMDDEEAKAALVDRDDAWAQHLSVLDRETADRFETRMRATDAAAAARLNSARQLEELRSLTAGLAVNVASVDRQRQLLRDIDDELQTLRREIRSETPAEIDLDDDPSVVSWLTRIGRWAERLVLKLVDLLVKLHLGTNRAGEDLPQRSVLPFHIFLRGILDSRNIDPLHMLRETVSPFAKPAKLVLAGNKNALCWMGFFIGAQCVAHGILGCRTCHPWNCRSNLIELSLAVSRGSATVVGFKVAFERFHCATLAILTDTRQPRDRIKSCLGSNYELALTVILSKLRLRFGF